MEQQQAPILVEWSSKGGREQVSVRDMVSDGSKALEQAMCVIENMAQRVQETAQKIAGDPQQRELKQVQVQFGLKLDAEAGAFLAKAGLEASIVVTMTWERP
jgi:hypothetical protein